MKTIKFYTLGCKVNQYDTQEIREHFLNAGFKETDNGRKADIYVINTCTVTHRADAKSFNLIHRAKRENPKAKIIVTGCLTELDEDKIKKIDRESLIVKNKDKENILNCLNKTFFDTNSHESKAESSRINSCKFDTNSCRLVLKGISYFKGHTRAFLKIQDGCNNFCSYCKVPLVRGRSRSRQLNEVVQEAEKLVRSGFKEIVLSGICLGSYGKDLLNTNSHESKAELTQIYNSCKFDKNSCAFVPERLSQGTLDLADVIEALENIEGLLRIRLSSIEAGDVSEGLIEKIAQSKELCRHLHIPIQSGDDEILKKMNRKFSRQDYSNLMQKIKRRIPEIAITTDVLVGFPGEEEVNFKNTLDLIKEISPLKVHIFPYSPRPGTAAYNLKDRISPLQIKERMWRLQNIANTCSLTYKKQFLNKDMDVLIEERAKENKEYWQGYTDNYIKVLVKSNQNLKNQLVQVRLM